MTRNLRKGRSRCLDCGLRTTLHFTESNRKISCAEARDAHPRASVKFAWFQTVLRRIIAEQREAVRS